MPPPRLDRTSVPLRLLHVIRSDAFAGVEQYVVYVVAELVARGHEVEVIGGDPDRMRAELGPWDVTCVPAARTHDAWRAAVARPRADVVHTHMTAAELAAIGAWPRHRRPIVTTLHFATRRGRTPLRSRAYRLMAPCFTREIAISEFVAREVGGDPLVIHNGVPRTSLPARFERDPIVLMAQRLEPEKETLVGIEAWRRSGLGARGWRLQIAGSGSEAARVRRASEGDTSIEVLGHVTDLHERRARASVFLATARAEPFGLSVVEAMAAGLPVVAADGGAHAELLGTGASILFRSGDAEGCAQALSMFAADSTLRDRAGRAACERYEREFTIERHVDRLEAVYREAAGARSGAR